MRYHPKLQGFIYRLHDGTPYVKLHDKREYRGKLIGLEY